MLVSFFGRASFLGDKLLESAGLSFMNFIQKQVQISLMIMINTKEAFHPQWIAINLMIGFETAPLSGVPHIVMLSALALSFCGN